MKITALKTMLGLVVYLLTTISTLVPSFRPPPYPTQVNCKEASTSQLWIIYVSFLLTSLGSGGIRPCVVTFAADQFDTCPNIKVFMLNKIGISFFNWYYFSMGIATLTALIIVVYIQEHVRWGWGLGIPTISRALSVVAFVIGSPLYIKLKSGGSPLVRLAQVIVAAFKKRN